MDVCLNTDRMLAYFDTSGHDNQTLREIHNKRTPPSSIGGPSSRASSRSHPAGEVVRGANRGDARRFAGSEAEFADFVKGQPSLLVFNTRAPAQPIRSAKLCASIRRFHAGPSPANSIRRSLREKARSPSSWKRKPRRLPRTSTSVRLLGSKLSKRSLGKVKGAKDASAGHRFGRAERR